MKFATQISPLLNGDLLTSHNGVKNADHLMDCYFWLNMATANLPDMGNKYDLPITDTLTKYAKICAFPNKEVETVTDAVFTK
jgi:hypothetical protein